MTYHVKIKNNYFSSQIDIWVARESYISPGGYDVYYPAQKDPLSFDVGRWVTIDQYGELPEDPSFQLPDGMGEDLLEALLDHYKGSENTRTLRKDYEAERARVDKLITGLLK